MSDAAHITGLSATARTQALDHRLEAATRRLQAAKTDSAKQASPAWKAAQEFEAVMLAQMFEPMFAGLKAEGPFGGGHAERTYRSLLLQAYGESVAETSSIGIAERVYQDIIRYYGGAEPSGDGESNG